MTTRSQKSSKPSQDRSGQQGRRSDKSLREGHEKLPAKLLEKLPAKLLERLVTGDTEPLHPPTKTVPDPTDPPSTDPGG
jgi:hypothetical protein